MFLDDSFFQPLVIKKKDKSYFIEGIEEDDYKLSHREMAKLLNQIYKIDVAEIAFMDYEFHVDPTATRAFFGVNNLFLYCK